MVSKNEITRIIDIVKYLESGSSDRKTIAEALGISLSTAGSITSTLISSGIAGEYMKKDGTRGRRTGTVYLLNNPVFAEAHISKTKITTYFFGSRLEITETDIFDITDPLFLDDCFITYFRRLSERAPKISGICLVCGGTVYDGRFLGSGIPGLDTLSLIKIAGEILDPTAIILQADSLLVNDNTVRLYAVITETGGNIKVSLVHNGTIVSGSGGGAGNMGRMTDFDERSIASRIRYASNADDYISAVAFLFNSVILLTDPDRLYFYSSRYTSTDIILRSVTEHLMLDYGHTITKLPRMSVFNPNDTSFTLSLRRTLRDKYITDIHRNNEL